MTQRSDVDVCMQMFLYNSNNQDNGIKRVPSATGKTANVFFLPRLKALREEKVHIVLSTASAFASYLSQFQTSFFIKSHRENTDRTSVKHRHDWRDMGLAHQ